MTITTTNQVAGPVNVVYQVASLRRAQMVCPYYVASVPGEVRSHSGTFTVKWRRYEHLDPVTTPLTEITGSVSYPTRTGVQPSVTDITATVQKYGNFIVLNEEVDLININDLSMTFADVLGENAGRSLNRIQRNEMEDNSTAVLAGTATTATGIASTAFISRSNVSKVVNALNNQNVRKSFPETLGSTNVGTAPIRESLWGLTHPDVEEDLRTLTGFNSVETYAGQTRTYPGEIGHLGGVRFIVSTESTVDAGGGATVTGTATIAGRTTSGNRTDIYNTVILGEDAVGSLGLDATHVKEIYQSDDRLPAVMMISHPKGSAGSADPLNEVSTAGWKSWAVGKILNGNWIRVLRHAASNL